MSKRSSKASKPEYAWPKQVHPRWWRVHGALVILLVALSFLGFPVFGVATLVALPFDVHLPFGTVVVTSLMTAFVLQAVAEGMLYFVMRCPRCGHNPTRRKDGKFLALKIMNARLREMAECPHCGFGPSAGRPTGADTPN